jgi:hypothetical protein
MKLTELRVQYYATLRELKKMVKLVNKYEDLYADEGAEYEVDPEDDILEFEDWAAFIHLGMGPNGETISLNQQG